MSGDVGQDVSGVEQVLVGIWRELLNDDSLDATSDFVDGGGSSLTAVRIRGYVREELGRDVAIEDVAVHRTPASLARVVAAAPAWDEDW